MVDYTEKAIEILTEHHPKGLHVNDLAGLVLKKSIPGVPILFQFITGDVHLWRIRRAAFPLSC